MNRVRSVAVGLCGVACIAGLLSGVILTYASRVLFDASMFSNRVANSLAEPPVARVVANQITDQILAHNPDVTPFRPIVLGTVQQFISSAPFRGVVRLAAKKLHPVLITHGESLSLTLGDVGVIVRDMLATHPQIAQKVPEKAHLILGSTESWPAGRSLLQVLRIGRRIQGRTIIWLAFGLVMGTLGLLVTRRKDRYLLRVGLSLTIAAFLLAGLARFGGTVLANLTDSPVISDLVRGLWPVFIGPLAIRMLILAGLGIILTASVTTLLEKADAATLALSVWNRAWRRPVRPAAVIARGLVLAIIGVVVALRPGETLEVLAVVAGGLVFFVGIQDVFTTATRFAGRSERAATVAKRKRGALITAMAAGLVLALLVGGAALWLARDSGESTLGPRPIIACNGYPELRDRKLNEVVFPTTHNSMSGADIANWMFANQERGIPEQLEEGVRGFLIDVHYGEPVKGRIKTLLENETNSRLKYEAALGKEGVGAAMRIRDRLVGEPEGKRQVYMAHGFCELGATPFVEALRAIKKFLLENPGEVLVIIIQDEGVTPADVAACFRESGLEDFVYRGPVAPPWPTLGQMVSRDERVVVLAENRAEGVPWYHLTAGVVQETPYGFKKPEAFSNAPNRGGRNGSLLLMNHWIESAPASLPSNAQIVNAYDFLLERARSCRRERRMLPNLIAVDFYRTGDLFRVARAMNGIKEPGPLPEP